MSCQFSINYPKQKDELVQKLEAAILQTNGQFDGDTSNGVFKGNTPVGSFSGSYTIHGDNIEVTIDKKPWLVSCNKIEDEINNYINQGLA
ncbi:MAG TPA: hypothetical protein VFQ50_06420 [Flavobacterium sp.]|jgi:lipopolysaccharide export system protein LptA|nr:hypothetical protein [Flavobacterium sp.]